MKDGFESLGRIRAQGIALLLVTFVVGGLAGVAFERVRASRQAPPFEAPMGMRPPFEDFMPGMFRELNLTAEQHRRVMTILRDSRPNTDSLLNAMLPRLRAVTDSVREEIRAVLTPEQAAVLDSLTSEMNKGRGRGRMGPMPRGSRRGPPPNF
jgi:Spy/CpxP family protein refolding chaperone